MHQLYVAYESKESKQTKLELNTAIRALAEILKRLNEAQNKD